MADELTQYGLAIDTLQQRIADVSAGLRTAISSILDLTADQPTGQFFLIPIEQIQAALELLQELHSSKDPDQSTGQSLDAICSITGTYRRAATKGTAPVDLDLDAATTAPAGTLFAVAGDPTNQWELVDDVTSVGAGVYAGTVRAMTAGAVQALINTITVIVTPVAGLNSVTNTAAATEGLNRETDTALRLRREIEVTLGGSGSVDSIRAELSEIEEIVEVYVYENSYWFAVAPMPPHSIEAVYWDAGAPASTTEIAAVIFSQKAAGIQAYGTNYETVTDTQGNDHEIGMTLADEQRIVVEVDVDDGADYVGDAAVAAAIVAWGLANLGIGDEVYRSKISAEVSDLDGVINVSQVQLSIWPAGVGAADITIGAREIATIDTADITVNS